MAHSPFDLFKKWYEEEKQLSSSRIPSACCLSTLGLDGYPNSRFLSLKEVLEGCFIVTGPISSRKGLEMEKNPNVALAFWWPHTEKQVRIQGTATRISNELSDRYFSQRERDSQVASIISSQGMELDDPEMLRQRYNVMQQSAGPIPLAKPATWGGYSIAPVRIEFMEFAPSRFHKRMLFIWADGEWEMKLLQP